MNVLSKYYSSTFDEARRRVMKVFGLGEKTADLIAPFGDDSCPAQGADVVYLETSNDNEPVIVGVLNTGLMAGPGEKRLFSKKADGTISFYTWHRNNGTYELGGTVDNAVRYAALNVALQAEVIKINAELVKISSAIAVAGGVYTPTPISLDITPAKINEIKTL